MGVHVIGVDPGETVESSAAVLWLPRNRHVVELSVPDALAEVRTASGVEKLESRGRTSGLPHVFRTAQTSERIATLLAQGEAPVFYATANHIRSRVTDWSSKCGMKFDDYWERWLERAYGITLSTVHHRDALCVAMWASSNPTLLDPWRFRI